MTEPLSDDEFSGMFSKPIDCCVRCFPEIVPIVNGRCSECGLSPPDEDLGDGPYAATGLEIVGVTEGEGFTVTGLRTNKED